MVLEAMLVRESEDQKKAEKEKERADWRKDREARKKIGRA